MSRRVLLLAVALLGTSLLSVGRSADTPKAKELKDDAKLAPSARTIDFAADLGLDFASLKSLGGRIQAGRETPDPVGLALAAQELALAEKISGKQASVKSADILKEAVEMAQRRFTSVELRAVAMIVTEEKEKKDLEALAAKAKKEEDARASGEKKRGIQGTLTVFNNAQRTLAIYVNDRYVGNVNANNEASFYVGQEPGTTTKLVARSGRFTWGPTYVPGEVSNYSWTLNPIKE